MRRIKYIFLKVILLLLIGLSHEYEYKSNDVITVSIYYSTSSIASKNFILNQLFPGYLKLGKYLKLDFLPYGITNMTIDTRGSFKFECVRGPEDCEGNIIQTCALQQTKDDKTKLKFVYCFMSDPKDNKIIEKCAGEADLDKKLIEKCRTENAKKILSYIGERTRQELPDRYTLPKVKLDGKFVIFMGNNFIDNICEVLRTVPECQNLPSYRRNSREIGSKDNSKYYSEMIENYGILNENSENQTKKSNNQSISQMKFRHDDDESKTKLIGQPNKKIVFRHSASGQTDNTVNDTLKDETRNGKDRELNGELNNATTKNLIEPEHKSGDLVNDILKINKNPEGNVGDSLKELGIKMQNENIDTILSGKRQDVKKEMIPLHSDIDELRNKEINNPSMENEYRAKRFIQKASNTIIQAIKKNILELLKQKGRYKRQIRRPEINRNGQKPIENVTGDRTPFVRYNNIVKKIPSNSGNNGMKTFTSDEDKVNKSLKKNYYDDSINNYNISLNDNTEDSKNDANVKKYDVSADTASGLAEAISKVINKSQKEREKELKQNNNNKNVRHETDNPTESIEISAIFESLIMFPINTTSSRNGPIQNADLQVESLRDKIEKVSEHKDSLEPENENKNGAFKTENIVLENMEYFTCNNYKFSFPGKPMIDKIFKRVKDLIKEFLKKILDQKPNCFRIKRQDHQFQDFTSGIPANSMDTLITEESGVLKAIDDNFKAIQEEMEKEEQNQHKKRVRRQPNDPNVKHYKVSSDTVAGLGKAISKVISDSQREREEELKHEGENQQQRRIKRQPNDPNVKHYIVSSDTVLGLGKAISKVIGDSQREREEELKRERENQKQKRIKRYPNDPYVKHYKISSDSVSGLEKGIAKVISENQKEREEELRHEGDNQQQRRTKRDSKDPYVKHYKVSSDTVLGLGKAISKVIGESQKEREEELKHEADNSQQKRSKRHPNDTDVKHHKVSSNTDAELGKAIAEAFGESQNEREEESKHEDNQQQQKIKTHPNDTNVKHHKVFSDIDVELEKAIAEAFGESQKEIEEELKHKGDSQQQQKIKRHPNDTDVKHQKNFSDIEKGLEKTKAEAFGESQSKKGELNDTDSDTVGTIRKSGKSNHQINNINRRNNTEKSKNNSNLFNDEKMHNISGLAEGSKNISNQNKRKMPANLPEITASEGIKDTIDKKISKRETTIRESLMREGRETIREYDLYNKAGIEKALKDLLGEDFKPQIKAEGGEVQLSPELGKKVVDAILEKRRNYENQRKLEDIIKNQHKTDNQNMFFYKNLNYEMKKRQAKIEKIEVDENGKKVEEYKITSNKPGDLEKALEDLLQNEEKTAKTNEPIISIEQKNFGPGMNDDGINPELKALIKETIEKYKEKKNEPEFIVQESSPKFYRNTINNEEPFNPFRISSHKKVYKPLFSFSVGDNNQLPPYIFSDGRNPPSVNSNPPTINNRQNQEYTTNVSPESTENPQKNNRNDLSGLIVIPITGNTFKKHEKIPNTFSSNVHNDLKSAEFKKYLDIDYDDFKYMSDNDHEYMYIEDDATSGKYYHNPNKTVLLNQNKTKDSNLNQNETNHTLQPFTENSFNFSKEMTKINANMTTYPFIYNYHENATQIPTISPENTTSVNSTHTAFQNTTDLEEADYEEYDYDDTGELYLGEIEEMIENSTTVLETTTEKISTQKLTKMTTKTLI